MLELIRVVIHHKIRIRIRATHVTINRQLIKKHSNQKLLIELRYKNQK
jgi:hypothetical protein